MRNFFRFGLALVLVFCEAMALSHIPNGVTASDDLSIGKVAQESRYQISGDRQGKVTVTDSVSGEVVRTFQMDEGVVVRETFLLDNGRTVAASQKDHAVFWDLATGREIRRLNRRIYGFSHDATRFFTYSYPEGVWLYSYPDIRQLCELTNRRGAGPGPFIFSPNDRFLVIGFASGFPSSDENYPDPDRTIRGTNYTQLYNIQTCEEIQEFSGLNVRQLGEFSPDSRFYNFRDVQFNFNGERSESSWQFDLTTYQLNKLVQ